MEQQTQSKTPVRDRVEGLIRKGIPYITIERETGADRTYIQRIAHRIEYEEPSAEIKEQIMRGIDKKPMVQLQKEYEVSRETIKQIRGEKRQMDFKQKIQIKQEIDAQTKMQIEQEIEEMLKNPEEFKRKYAELKKQADVGKTTAIVIYANAFLKRGALRKADQINKLGMQAMGKNQNTPFDMLDDKIKGYQIQIKMKDWNDWVKTADFFCMPVAKAKDLARRVNLADITPKKVQPDTSKTAPAQKENEGEER